jgi:hypothetical protein
MLKFDILPTGLLISVPKTVPGISSTGEEFLAFQQLFCHIWSKKQNALK